MASVKKLTSFTMPPAGTDWQRDYGRVCEKLQKVAVGLKGMIGTGLEKNKILLSMLRCFNIKVVFLLLEKRGCFKIVREKCFLIKEGEDYEY